MDILFELLGAPKDLNIIPFVKLFYFIDQWHQYGILNYHLLFRGILVLLALLALKAGDDCFKMFDLSRCFLSDFYVVMLLQTDRIEQSGWIW